MDRVDILATGYGANRTPYLAEKVAPDTLVQFANQFSALDQVATPFGLCRIVFG